jgi:hypothetical protein
MKRNSILNLSGIAALTTQQGDFFLGAMKYAMLIHVIFAPTYALAADCHGPRFQFCKNCDTQISLTVNKNIGCTLFIHRSEGYEALNIVGRPKHGKVGIEERSRPRPGKNSYAAHISYVPQSGFSGIVRTYCTPSFSAALVDMKPTPMLPSTSDDRDLVGPTAETLTRPCLRPTRRVVRVAGSSASSSV